MFDPATFFFFIITASLLIWAWMAPEQIRQLKLWSIIFTLAAIVGSWGLVFQILGYPEVPVQKSDQHISHLSFYWEDALLVEHDSDSLWILDLESLEASSKIPLLGRPLESRLYFDGPVLQKGRETLAMLSHSASKDENHLLILGKGPQWVKQLQLPGEKESHCLIWQEQSEEYWLTFKIEGQEDNFETPTNFGRWQINEQGQVLKRDTLPVESFSFYTIAYRQGQWFGAKMNSWVPLEACEGKRLKPISWKGLRCEAYVDEDFWGTRLYSPLQDEAKDTLDQALCLQGVPSLPQSWAQVKNGIITAQIRKGPEMEPILATYFLAEEGAYFEYFKVGEHWFSQKREPFETWGYDRDMLTLRKHDAAGKVIAERLYPGHNLELSFYPHKNHFVLMDQGGRHLRLDPQDLSLLNSRGVFSKVRFYLRTYWTRGWLFQLLWGIALCWPLVGLGAFVWLRKKPKRYYRFLLISQVWAAPLALYLLIRIFLA